MRLGSEAACRMVWTIRCPYLLRGFLIAYNAEVLSQRIGIISCSGVVKAVRLSLTVMRTSLVALNMPK